MMVGQQPLFEMGAVALYLADRYATAPGGGLGAATATATSPATAGGSAAAAATAAGGGSGTKGGGAATAGRTVATAAGGAEGGAQDADTTTSSSNSSSKGGISAAMCYAQSFQWVLFSQTTLYQAMFTGFMKDKLPDIFKGKQGRERIRVDRAMG